MERQIYERSLKSEPSIVKLIEKISDLSKLSTLSESSIMKFIENQCEHLSKLTLYHLKKRATMRSRRAREPSRILRGLNNKNSMLKKFVFKKISTIHIPKSSKLHRYVNKVRKLYNARYKCNNKRDPKIINFNEMAIPKKLICCLSILAEKMSRYLRCVIMSHRVSRAGIESNCFRVHLQ